MTGLRKKIMSILIASSMIISVFPVIGYSAAIENAILVEANFDGTDNTSKWAAFDVSDIYKPDRTAGEVDAENGWLMTKNVNAGYGSWGIYFGEGEDSIDTDGKENIYVTTRFKANGFAKNELFKVRGIRSDDSNQVIVALTDTEDGYLAYGGQHGNSTVSSYKLNNDTWYNLEVRLDYVNQDAYIYISDDNGNAQSMKTGFADKGAFTYRNLIQVVTMATDLGGEFYIDYLRIHDKDLLSPVTATYGEDRKELDNSSDIISSTQIYLDFENAVTEADMEGITINNNAVVEKSLSEDGKTVILNVSGLNDRDVYVLDIPIIGLNANERYTFYTADNPAYLFRAEFDGKDNTTNWAKFDQGGTVQVGSPFSGRLTEEGYLEMTQNTAGYGRWGVYYGTGSDALQIDKTKNNIVLETRFMSSEENFANGRSILVVYGRRTGFEETDSLGLFILTVNNGKLCYGGMNGNETTSEFEMNADTWYTLKATINYGSKNVIFNISDDSGNEEDITVGFPFGWEYENITQITSLDHNGRSNTNSCTYVDYLRLYDKDLLPAVTATYGEEGKNLEGANDIGTSVTAYVNFENPIEEADMDLITVNNGAIVEKSLSADGKIVTLNITGLTERNQYVLDVPSIGANADLRISFNTADDPKYLFRAEFDGKDSQALWKIFNSSGGITDLASDQNFSDKLSNGQLVLYSHNSSYGKFGVIFDPSVDVSDKENIYWETRVRIVEPESDQSANGTLGVDSQMFKLEDENGIGVYVATRRNEAGEGVLAYGNNDTTNAITSDYKLYSDTWYTFRIKMNFVTDKFSVTVRDDNGNVYEGPETNFQNNADLSNIHFFKLPRHLYGGRYTYTEYTRMWDNDMLSHVNASYNGGTSLTDARNVPLEFDATLTFPEEITNEEMNAITTSVQNAVKTLSEDKTKVTIHFEGLDYYSEYSIDIPETDAYSGDTIKFVTKSEDKYLFQAEFNGYDDYTYLYGRNGDNYQHIDNSDIVDGNLFMSKSVAGQRWHYRYLNVKFDEPIDLENKENIMVQMRFKWTDGDLHENFFSITPNATEGSPVVRFKIKNGNQLYYHNDAVEGGEVYANYDLEKNYYYTFTVKMNFSSNKYSATITDDYGNIATIPETNFVYNKNLSSIYMIDALPLLAESMSETYVDYLRLWDEDYGKAQVTYGDGYKLDNSVLVPVSGNVFNITLSKTADSTEGVILKDINGTQVESVIFTNENKITIIPQQQLAYNTKYTLDIPGDITGTGIDQTISFTTTWDTSKEFVVPPVFEGKDDLSVVFFGGSITQQEGWRVHVTNQIKEWFPNATCYNSAIGGTGSEYGWMRLERDVMSKNPDLVFVEFAVNDSSNSQTATYIESIVRNLNKLENPPVIIFVYTTVLNFDANSYAISEQGRIAQAYGIPEISIRDYMRSLYNTNSIFANEWNTTTKYLSDGTHPTELGSQYYGEYVNNLLTSDSLKYFVKPKANNEVTPVTDFYDYYFEYTALNKTLTSLNETYEIQFEGDEFVLEIAKSKPNGGTFDVSVDGAVLAEDLNAYHVDGSPSVAMHRFTGLGNGAHTMTVTVSGKTDVSEGYNVTLQGTYACKKTGVDFEVPVFSSTTVIPGTALTATAEYVGYEEQNVTLVIALYDEAGKLTGIQNIETTTDSTGTLKEISTSVTPKTGDVKAKAFLWDSMDNMHALTEAASIGF